MSDLTLKPLKPSQPMDYQAYNELKSELSVDKTSDQFPIYSAK